MREIPFRAALFDLDGTLLDSMYVWKHIDQVFFQARGLEQPGDFGYAIAGLSYQESAQYAVEHYFPDERWEDIVEEWQRLAEEEYACRVPLKPGSAEYVKMLKRAGVRLAVTTALPPRMYEPCLKRLGLYDLFDELCSTDHVGGQGKANGEVFLLAAQRLGVAPADCAVFEDVLAGVIGAKRAGMRAYCIRDEHSARDFSAMAERSDFMMDSIDEMKAVHDFPAPQRCVVLTAYCEGDPTLAFEPREDDFVLCADGGWKLAERLGLRPQRVIGDFDSSEAPPNVPVERHPRMKDDTDSMLCLKYGMRLGYDSFLFVGGFGGRLDHTLANLQMLNYAAEHGVRARIADGRCQATVLKNGTARIPRRPGKLSLFAVSDVCEGITTRGTLYVLNDDSLTNTFPLGVSNEYTADEVEITVRKGTLLIVQTDDQQPPK